MSPMFDQVSGLFRAFTSTLSTASAAPSLARGAHAFGLASEEDVEAAEQAASVAGQIEYGVGDDGMAGLRGAPSVLGGEVPTDGSAFESWGAAAGGVLGLGAGQGIDLLADWATGSSVSDRIDPMLMDVASEYGIPPEYVAKATQQLAQYGGTLPSALSLAGGVAGGYAGHAAEEVGDAASSAIDTVADYGGAAYDYVFGS